MRSTCLALLVFVGGVGCGDDAPESPDALTPEVDLASPVEAGIDLASPVGDDLATSADLAPASADLSPAPPLTGLDWPMNRAFPRFAAFDTLDVIDVEGRPDDEKNLFATLEGVVNRTQPRVYLLDGFGEGKTFWLDLLGLPAASVNRVADPYSLVTKYRSELAGVVITDDAVSDTVNLATTFAGVKRAVVASPALAARLTAAPYLLPVVADLRTNAFKSKLEVYDYGLQQLGSQVSHRILCGISPSVSGYVRDYAAATGAMVVWLDPRNADEKALLTRVGALLAVGSPYVGWWADEGTGVQAAAQLGLPVFAADWAANFSVLGGVRTPLHPPVMPPKPALQTKIYVTLILSDGDNVQENEHLIPMKWADANRGKIPIGWTTNAALVDLAPVILEHFFQTATVNDALISGPSGLGYTYPSSWSSSSLDLYTQRSGAYLQEAGLRVITIWNRDTLIAGNDGKDLSSAEAASYATHLPHLLGLTLQGGWLPIIHDNSILNSTLPLVRLVQTYAQDEAGLESGIDNGGKYWTRTGPAFLAVQGNMNSGTMNPTAFYATVQHYAANTDYVFVRPDHFFQLFREANGLPINP
jgi:hypothetical protein